METLGAFIDAAARDFGGRPALLTAEEQVTYADLARHAERLAAGLARLGVATGTHVGLLMPNRPEWLACAFAVFRLGAILVPLNTLHRRAELEYALRHADVNVLITVDRFLNHAYVDLLRQIVPEIAAAAPPIVSAALPALREVVVAGAAGGGAIRALDHVRADGTAMAGGLGAVQAGVAPSDPAAIFFTSGTTAAPKGAVHTHASMLYAARNVADCLGLTADDRTWGYLPFFFTGGLVAVALATLSRGGAVLLQEVFDPGATLKLMAEHHCTTLFAWPHQAEALIAHPEFAATPLALRKGVGANTAWAAHLYPPDHQAVGTWGMTETGPMATSSRFDDPLPVRAGAHGRPMPGLDMRIIDPNTGTPLPVGQDGELVVRGASVMAHYYKMTPADCFDADGYFHSGDLARVDAAGCLHFLGRFKDVIKTAGVNVAAAEVEAVLQDHPGVTLACVVGVPHPARGESIAAFVVRRDPGCSEDDLLAFCRARLASYKVPQHVFFCSEADLPVLGSGKVDKGALRALAVERLLPSPFPSRECR